MLRTHPRHQQQRPALDHRHPLEGSEHWALPPRAPAAPVAAAKSLQGSAAVLLLACPRTRCLQSALLARRTTARQREKLAWAAREQDRLPVAKQYQPQHPA